MMLVPRVLLLAQRIVRSFPFMPPIGEEGVEPQSSTLGIRNFLGGRPHQHEIGSSLAMPLNT